MADVDAAREIRRSVDTGKAIFGFKETEKNVLKGNGELIIVSQSMTAHNRDKLMQWSTTFDIPVFSFDGKGSELGSVCGKPFAIGTMLIMDAGKSKVLEIVSPAQKKTKKK